MQIIKKSLHVIVKHKRKGVKINYVQEESYGVQNTLMCWFWFAVIYVMEG